MVMNQPFTTASPILANYDYNDVSQGTGIITFYGIASETSGGWDYHLITNPVKTAGDDDADLSLSELMIRNGDYDFDLTEFNMPMTAKGIAYFSAEADSVSGSPLTAAVQIRKWDGANETNISSVITSQTVNGEKEGIFLSIPLTTTHFKAGETLRVNVTISGAGASKGLGICPLSSQVESQSLQPMKVLIPFKLNR